MTEKSNPEFRNPNFVHQSGLLTNLLLWCKDYFSVSQFLSNTYLYIMSWRPQFYTQLVYRATLLFKKKFSLFWNKKYKGVFYRSSYVFSICCHMPHISPSGMQLMQNLCNLGKFRLIISKTFPQQRHELVHRHQKFPGHHYPM